MYLVSIPEGLLHVLQRCLGTGRLLIQSQKVLSLLQTSMTSMNSTMS
jgi:hypothetical protein